MITRRLSLIAAWAAAGCALSGCSSLQSAATTSRAVELTFLKSNPGERENLKRFIVANWFAMDKVAKAQGLMDAFTVVDTGSDDGAWNVMVGVWYRDARGYAGIRDAFEAIRRAHLTVLIDGKGLRELGAIVDSKLTFENPTHRTL